MDLDGLLTEKFDSGLLNFDKMNDAWMSHRELDPVKKLEETLSKYHPKLQIITGIFKKV